MLEEFRNNNTKLASGFYELKNIKHSSIPRKFSSGIHPLTALHSVQSPIHWVP